jgi:hypothetical protein
MNRDAWPSRRFLVKPGIELLGVATNSWVPTQFSSYEDLACSNSLPAIICSVGVLYKVAQITLFQ